MSFTIQILPNISQPSIGSSRRLSAQVPGFEIIRNKLRAAAVAQPRLVSMGLGGFPRSTKAQWMRIFWAMGSSYKRWAFADHPCAFVVYCDVDQSDCQFLGHGPAMSMIWFVGVVGDGFLNIFEIDPTTRIIWVRPTVWWRNHQFCRGNPILGCATDLVAAKHGVAGPGSRCGGFPADVIHWYEEFIINHEPSLVLVTISHGCT